MELDCQTEDCTHGLGRRRRDPFFHREESEVHATRPSATTISAASRADAAFRFAMISIRSGVKPRVSQRCRNNCRRLKWKWGPGPFSGRTATPPTLVCPGAGGDGERSHGLKLNYNIYMLHMAASRTVGPNRMAIVSGAFR